MVENELVLRQFVARHLDTMPQEQLELYSTFLDEADPVRIHSNLSYPC